MKTNDLLNELNQNVSDAYDVIEAGGGVVPSDRITWNLANAIRTIPQAHYPEYGRVAYYPTRIGYKASGEEVTVNSINETKLSEFFELYPPEDMNYIEFMFEPEWDPETGEPIPGTGSWRYYWEEGDLEIAQDDFASTTGIDCTIISEDGYVQIMVQQAPVPDTEADLLYATFASAQQFAAYRPSRDSYTGTIGEATVQANCIKEVQVGTEITSLPDFFMGYTDNLDTLDMSQAHITTVGNYFMSWSGASVPVSLPECTTIGPGFLENASNFNQTVSLPRVTAIPNAFMRGCVSFNQPFSLAGVTSIGVQFLYGNKAFNQNITIPTTLTKLGERFLQDCDSMTGTVTIEAPKTIINDPVNNFATQNSNAACYTTGITFTGTYGQDWFNLHIPLNGTSNFYRKILGYSLPTKNYVLSTQSGVVPMAQSDVSVLCSSGAGTVPITFANGTSVKKNTITEINFDYAITTVGNYFCNAMVYLKTLTMPNANLTSVGTYFLASTSVSSVDVRNITYIPQYFMFSCYCKNVLLPSAVTGIGDNAFKQARIATPITLEVNGPIGAYFLYYATFENDNCDITLTGTCPSIGNYFLATTYGNKSYTLTLPPALVSIGDYFLSQSASIPTAVNIPNTVTTIGNNFIDSVYSFNSPVTLSNSLTTIGNYFMFNCNHFNQELRMPQTLTSVGTYFMYRCDMLTTAVVMGGLAPTVFASDSCSFATTNKTAAVFATGFPINSTNFSGFRSRFGDNLSSSPYRKLIAA